MSNGEESLIVQPVRPDTSYRQMDSIVTLMLPKIHHSVLHFVMELLLQTAIMERPGPGFMKPKMTSCQSFAVSPFMAAIVPTVAVLLVQPLLVNLWIRRSSERNK